MEHAEDRGEHAGGRGNAGHRARGSVAQLPFLPGGRVPGGRGRQGTKCGAVWSRGTASEPGMFSLFAKRIHLIILLEIKF